MSCEALKQLERHNVIVAPKAAASALAAQPRIVSARELCVTLGKIIKISQRLLKLMARARISEFESYMPSQAVGLCRPNRWLVTAAAVTTGRGGRGAPSSRNHGSHSLARMPRPARLLRLWTMSPQCNSERGLAIRRSTDAVSLPTNGLHTLWNDWCRCAPRLGAAC